ncbi:hypothetical protein DFA_00328 [Cavenderia fasciculata]|uniref:C2 domain-containing protein n=1 Tax=Cavenderia fasciculata TaxID=261658 RepID=F4PR56_CACFS|nr:uncharacterized protein DFA_00328 [Cavenderia fasciculata]EGG20467.1 hypothetical protein DFA_00328 [Cavenderia fasciculata]|eukprot:XP_004358317.1 hypothetical protein DFA_00328 [Cavenderia fasciculata]
MGGNRIKVSDAERYPCDYEGFLQKEGGNIKSWKKRWCILKGNKIFYFKYKGDQYCKGFIVLEKNSVTATKSGQIFTVYTSVRTFVMHCEVASQVPIWVEKIQRSVAILNGQAQTVMAVAPGSIVVAPQAGVYQQIPPTQPGAYPQYPQQPGQQPTYQYPPQYPPPQQQPGAAGQQPMYQYPPPQQGYQYPPQYPPQPAGQQPMYQYPPPQQQQQQPGAAGQQPMYQYPPRQPGGASPATQPPQASAPPAHKSNISLEKQQPPGQAGQPPHYPPPQPGGASPATQPPQASAPPASSAPQMYPPPVFSGAPVSHPPVAHHQSAPQMYPTLPPQQQQPFASYGMMPAVAPMPFSSIIDGRLNPPPGTTLFNCGNGCGEIIVRIISAKNLVAADLNGKSDPYTAIRTTTSKEPLKTKVKPKTLNPTWEQSFTLPVNDVLVDMLILEVWDHDTVGNDDLIGFVGIDLALLPRGVEVITWENLSFVEHGELQVGITATNFGIQNFPPNYPLDYIQWRSSLPAVSRKGMKKEKHEVKKQAKENKTQKSNPSGPYASKSVHHNYQLVNGWLKKKKTKTEKFASGAKSTGIVLGAIVLGALG